MTSLCATNNRLQFNITASNLRLVRVVEDRTRLLMMMVYSIGHSLGVFLLFTMIGNSLGWICYDMLSTATTSKSALKASLSSLPSNISPYLKSEAKTLDITGQFRKVAQTSLQKALDEGLTQLEIEFPPLIGSSKNQFDDFDNVQELNKNRDWCIEWLPALSSVVDPIWFILPDTKEVELAKGEWTGQRYRKAATFTSIEAVTRHYSSSVGSGKDDGDSLEYSKPWGATLASGMSQLLGGNKGDSGLLGDLSALDNLEGSAKVHVVCQPGNGGPVEDWINVKKFHDVRSAPTVIVNGALDKVRDGYYNGFIFPALAKTFDFYKAFESIFFLKPVSDKGVYGWLYRVYPEPWQVVLQTPYTGKDGRLSIQDSVALVSDTRPSYQECVQALLKEASLVKQD